MAILSIPQGKARSVLALACAAALTAACGVAAPSSAAPATSGGAPQTITVTMTEFAFALDQPPNGPGAYVFHAVNAGKYPHSVELTAPASRTREQHRAAGRHDRPHRDPAGRRPRHVLPGRRPPRQGHGDPPHHRRRREWHWRLLRAGPTDAPAGQSSSGGKPRPTDTPPGGPEIASTSG